MGVLLSGCGLKHPFTVPLSLSLQHFAIKHNQSTHSKSFYLINGIIFDLFLWGRSPSNVHQHIEVHSNGMEPQRLAAPYSIASMVWCTHLLCCMMHADARAHGLKTTCYAFGHTYGRCGIVCLCLLVPIGISTLCLSTAAPQTLAHPQCLQVFCVRLKMHRL